MHARDRHAVLVRVALSDDDLGTPSDDELVDRLEDAIRKGLEREPYVGHWDGHEFGTGWAVVFCYGADPEPLSERIIEALIALDLPSAISVVAEHEQPESVESLRLVTTRPLRDSEH